MVTHLSRDYLTQNVTTANRSNIPSYMIAMFLRRILKYTYIGDTNFPINALGSLLIATGDSTPTGATSFPAGKKAGIANNVAAIEVSIPLPTGTDGYITGKGVAAADVGRMLVLKSPLYPTRNAGTFLISALQQGNTTTIAAGSNNVALPTGTINVASTTGFPGSGTIFIGPSTTTTTVVALTGTFTLTVGSTTGFPASGSLLVLSTTGLQTVAYTGGGGGGTTFTGCTGGSGSTFSGGTVTTTNSIQTITYTSTNATQFLGCTGGVGTLITGETVYNQNKYVIDYRGNGDLSLPEAADTVEWYLYDKDINCPGQGAVNGGTGYRGNGTSTTPRIILQSTHATGWQVRICNETNQDAQTNLTVAFITCAPGFGGNSAGDFPVGGEHLHTAQYYDTADANFQNGFGLGDNAGLGPQFRVTMIGDDTGQSFHIIGRRPLNALTPPSFYMSFGLPDNEPAPLPIRDVRRLYTLGNCITNNAGNTRLNDVSLLSGGTNQNSVIQGAAMHIWPISLTPSLLTYLASTSNQGSGPAFDAQAGDSPFTSATELVPVDLLTGVVPNWTGSSITLPFYPRVIGQLPIVKTGRTNFGDYTLTTDNATFSVSTTSGNGVSPIQITTTATNTLVTGQVVAINGVGGNTAANGTFTITVINGTQFTLNGTTGNGNFTSGGTVLRGAAFQHMRRGIYIPWNGPAVVP